MAQNNKDAAVSQKKNAGIRSFPPPFGLDKSYEEDAVFAAHTDAYWDQSDLMLQRLLQETFSTEETDTAGANLYDADHEDYRWTIGLSAELLRIYVASGITILTQEAIRLGIPQERVMEIRRRAFVALSEENDTERWGDIAKEVSRSLHDEYIALKSHSVSLHPAVRKACTYIYLHRLEPISASDVAAHLNTDRTYLSRLFRADLNTTISDQILSVKMEQAAEWVRKSHYALEEIAANLGFSSYAYFSRRFREYFGVSPRKMRQGGADGVRG